MNVEIKIKFYFNIHILFPDASLADISTDTDASDVSLADISTPISDHSNMSLADISTDEVTIASHFVVCLRPNII